MTPAGLLSVHLCKDAGWFGSFFSGVINLGQCELGTHLSLWQVKDHWRSPSGEDNEVTYTEKQKQGGTEGIMLSLKIQQCLNIPTT